MAKGYSVIDLKTWDRRDVFRFYRGFSDPYCGVCLDADCTSLWREAGEQGVAVSAALMHRVLLATDAAGNFRLRLAGRGVRLYDRLSISGVFLRPDGTMGFSAIPYRAGLREFAAAALAEKERVLGAPGLALRPPPDPRAVIYYSNAPWFRFTQITHPVDAPRETGVPRVTTGRIFRQGRRLKVPLSIYFHHALLDGVHVAEFVRAFER